jgi:calcineurin-like phosphoesterase family protein
LALNKGVAHTLYVRVIKTFDQKIYKREKITYIMGNYITEEFDNMRLWHTIDGTVFMIKGNEAKRLKLTSIAFYTCQEKFYLSNINKYVDKNSLLNGWEI